MTFPIESQLAHIHRHKLQPVLQTFALVCFSIRPSEFYRKVWYGEI